MTDSPDCSIDLANKIIFDKGDQERPPCKIGCNAERSMIICFIHFLVHLLNCFVHSLPVCFQFWWWGSFIPLVSFSIFRGLYYTNAEMIKRISTDPHLLMTVVGPSGSGKSVLVADLLVQAKVFNLHSTKFYIFTNTGNLFMTSWKQRLTILRLSRDWIGLN